MRQKNAFVLAATHSGCGKTTLTLGLLCLLRQRGLRVQPFKVGPDYLDTGWHSAISGTPSRNLDSFAIPDSTLNAMFTRHMRDADIAIIEGVMGLYDGHGTDPDFCSSAAMAKQLGCPVILMVDGKAVSTSLAATVLGFRRFDPALNIGGVIINRVNSDSHFALLKQAIEHYCGIPVLGRVPVVKDIELPSRHLGLVSVDGKVVDLDSWQRFASMLEDTIDVDRLLALTTLTNMPQGDMPPLPDSELAEGLTLAVARDEAFNFYYQGNLDLIEQAGISLRYFSPIHDEAIPPCDMVWFGGGYPEIHVDKLSANHRMLDSVQKAHLRGTPIYGECGGLMYLGESLIDSESPAWPLCGILPGQSQMGARLRRFGYCEARAQADTLLAKRGEILRGHEFHYSDFITDARPVFDYQKTRGGEITRRWVGGWQVGNTLGSYLHLDFLQHPSLLDHWCLRARHV